jgi:hypothetical protein
LTIIRECYCREISFCVLAADAGTKVVNFQSIPTARPSKPKGVTSMSSKTFKDHPFLKLVERIKAEKGCTKTQAMKFAVRRDPNMHKAFIASANA